MVRPLAPILLSATVLFAPLAAHPAELAIDLGEHGVLALTLPAGWSHELEETDADAPPTITLRAEDKGNFLAILTPVWAEPGGAPDFGTPSGVHRIVKKSAVSIAPTAVERPLEIKDFGSGRTGYWFTATDKSLMGQAPGKGEYRYMTQGALMVGELMCVFTFLANDRPSREVERAMDILRNAAHRSGA